MFWCAFFVHTNDYFASQGEFWSVSYQKRQQFRLKDRYYCRMVAIPITTHVRQTITHNPLPIKELAAVVASFLPIGFAGVAGAMMLLFVSGHEVQDDQYDDYWAHNSLIVRELFCYEFQYQHWVEVLAVFPPA